MKPLEDIRIYYLIGQGLVQHIYPSASLALLWKSDLTDKMKRSFFQAAVVSILLYGCTTWTLTKRLERKLDGNYTRMLQAILNKSWRQHPTKHQLYGHLPPITKTIQVRRTRHARQCWRSRDEVITDVLLWTSTYGRAKAGQPARTYIQQLCEDTGYSPGDRPEAMNDWEKWRERVRDIRASDTTWWWWWANILKEKESHYWKIWICLTHKNRRSFRYFLLYWGCHLSSIFCVHYDKSSPACYCSYFSWSNSRISVFGLRTIFQTTPRLKTKQKNAIYKVMII